MNRDKFENTINDISSMSGRLHDASTHYRLNEMHEASENVENMTDDLLAEFDRLTARIAELEKELELLRTPMSKRAAYTHRGTYTCPRCGNWCESEITLSDGRTTCPACENEVLV
jgi:rubrerythrin